MLARFRAFAKSPVALVLIVVLVASFGIWSIRDVFRGGTISDAVVQAGPRSISSTQFRGLFERYLASLQQQNNGQAVSPADAVKQGLDARALDELSYEESLDALITREGVRPSDQLVLGELRKAQRFFDPITGKFSRPAYEEFLHQNNLTAAQLEGSLRDQIAQTHELTGLVAGLQAPRAFVALAAAYNSEARRFTYATLTPGMVPAPTRPTDAQLQAYLTQNAAALTKPEMRQVSLVRFSAQQLAPTVALDPAAVQKRLDFEKDTLSTPEKRSFVAIPLRSPTQAAAVVARLRGGEPAAAVARSLGVQPVVYADQAKATAPDAGVADAAFSMTVGQVQGPVSGSLGPAVVQLSAITPGHAASPAEARAKVEAEVRRTAAIAKANELVQAYEDARQGGASLVQAAQKIGAQVQPLPPFDAQGRSALGQPVPVPSKLVQTAFTLAQGAASDVQEAGQNQGEFYAIQLDRVIAPAPFTVDEVRAPLTQRLMTEALMRSLQAKADALVDAVRHGATLAAAARGMGATVQQAQAGRGDADTKTFSRDLLGKLFAAKAGELITASDVKPGVVVARVDAVVSASPQVIAQAAQAQRRQASLAIYEDVADHAREAARAIIRPRVNLVRARQALGVAGDTGAPRP